MLECMWAPGLRARFSAVGTLTLKNYSDNNYQVLRILERNPRVFRKGLWRDIMPKPAKHFYEFGPFRIYPTERSLLRDGEVVLLPPKVFDLLLFLVQNHGHLLQKDTLIKAIWPESFVEEGNLTRYISTLRQVLGEGQNGQTYIETVPRIGYRFVAEVREVGSKGLDLAAHSPVAVEEKKAGDEAADVRQKRAQWRKAAIAAGVA